VRNRAAFGSEDYIAALHEEFSEEEIEQAWKDCRRIKRIYRDWLELHPDLKDEVDDANCVGMLKASVSENIHGDVITLLIIVLHTGDAAREQELAEELMELVAETGVAIKPYTGRHPMFLPCIASEE